MLVERQVGTEPLGPMLVTRTIAGPVFERLPGRAYEVALMVALPLYAVEIAIRVSARAVARRWSHGVARSSDHASRPALPRPTHAR